MMSESERIDRYLAAQVWMDALRGWRRPRPPAPDPLPPNRSERRWPSPDAHIGKSSSADEGRCLTRGTGPYTSRLMARCPSREQERARGRQELLRQRPSALPLRLLAPILVAGTAGIFVTGVWLLVLGTAPTRFCCSTRPSSLSGRGIRVHFLAHLPTHDPFAAGRLGCGPTPSGPRDGASSNARRRVARCRPRARGFAARRHCWLGGQSRLNVGFVLLALTTAAIASLFVREAEEPEERREHAFERKALAELHELNARLELIESRLPPSD